VLDRCPKTEVTYSPCPTEMDKSFLRPIQSRKWHYLHVFIVAPEHFPPTCRPLFSGPSVFFKDRAWSCFYSLCTKSYILYLPEEYPLDSISLPDAKCYSFFSCECQPPVIPVRLRSSFLVTVRSRSFHGRIFTFPPIFSMTSFLWNPRYEPVTL